MTRRSRLFTSSILFAAAAAFSTPVLAQETEVDELIVTGSRIPRPNLEQPTPVTTITDTGIQNAGTSSLGEVIAQLPALASSGTVRANSDSGANLGGLSFPDLRSLGTSRTLTLVNGKRHVAGDAGDTAVDLNAIPTAMVERVEVTTGGASAIYGSDAVTGVINIILKDDFEGIEVNAQGGGPLNGNYGQNYSASVMAGWNISDRGNITVTAFADKQERVRGPDVEGLADWATVANPADTGTADGIPDRIFRPFVFTEFFDEQGSIATLNLVPVTGFSPSGQPLPIPPRTGENNLFFGSFAGPCAVCFSTDEGTVLIPRMLRYGLASTFHYDLTPSIRVRGDVKYVRSELIDTFSPSFTIFEYVLDPDNAFITPAIQSVLNQFPNDFFIVSRINQDIGGRNDDTTRETFRSVLSLEGESDAGFADVNWEVAYNFGRTRNKFESFGGLIPGNFNSAIDAVVDPANGQIRCRRDVPATWYPGYAPLPADQLTNEGCIPFNLFGSQNTLEAINYVTFEAERKHAITQQVASATFAFDSSRFLTLPGGPIGFAGGVEWRRENSRNINDPLVQSGITETAPQPNASGGFEVREVFAETRIPILREAPLAHNLTVEGAIRYAEYSHAGEATSYMLRGIWAPVQDVTFRGTFSKATRAPNITEAFLPATPGFNAIFDPCEFASIGEDPDRPANCAALGVTFDDATDNQFPGVTSGNVDLRSEEAETWTVGFVLQPRFLPDLTLTVDYYNIEITDAISFLDPQDAADKCVDGPELALEYCNLIIRDPVTRQIQSYISTFLNQAALTTAGYDIQLGYGRDIADWTSGMGFLSALDGRINASLTANYTEKLREFAFADFPDTVDREEGEVGDPRWSFISSLSYRQGPVTLTWESQYIDEVRRNKDQSAERTDRPTIEEVWYHDLIARYALGYFEESEVYVGVNNIFDKTMPVGITGNTPDTAAYDIYGRYLFAGVRLRF
jgi:iron complex outermembrane recepter protein